jgi:hypothetical protein
MGTRKQKNMGKRNQKQRQKRAAKKRALIERLKREAERMGLPNVELTDEYMKSKRARLQNTHILRANNGGRLQGQRVKLRTGRA